MRTHLRSEDSGLRVAMWVEGSRILLRQVFGPKCRAKADTMTLEMRLGGEVGAELSISRRESLSMRMIPSYSPAEHAHGGSRLDFRNGALLGA